MMPTACFKAIDLVVTIREANRQVVDTSSIAIAVNDWYTLSDVTDPEMLAAAVLEFGRWRMISFLDWESAHHEWFPPHEDLYGVWEFEESYRDELWR